jgi:hypothetical protein
MNAFQFGQMVKQALEDAEYAGMAENIPADFLRGRPEWKPVSGEGLYGTNAGQAREMFRYSKPARNGIGGTNQTDITISPFNSNGAAYRYSDGRAGGNYSSNSSTPPVLQYGNPAKPTTSPPRGTGAAGARPAMPTTQSNSNPPAGVSRVKIPPGHWDKQLAAAKARQAQVPATKAPTVRP